MKRKRRGLSGIFIFDQFEGEEKCKPTCFEDCREETQDKWLDELSISGLKSLSKKLAGTIKFLGNEFDITTEF